MDGVLGHVPLRWMTPLKDYFWHTDG